MKILTEGEYVVDGLKRIGAGLKSWKDDILVLSLRSDELVDFLRSALRRD